MFLSVTRTYPLLFASEILTTRDPETRELPLELMRLRTLCGSARPGPGRERSFSARCGRGIPRRCSSGYALLDCPTHTRDGFRGRECRDHPRMASYLRHSCECPKPRSSADENPRCGYPPHWS